MKKKRHSSFIDRTGERHITNEGYEIEIIEYFNNRNCTVKFICNNVIKHNVQYDTILRGQIGNPYHPSVCGVGYLGEGEYVSAKGGKHTKSYEKWRGILRRCYNEKSLIKSPTYKICSVDERWHNFQVFAEWFEKKRKSHMEGWDLDKDILKKGNKIYSPETCCFVPQEINSLFIKHDKLRGKYPIGVHKRGNSYISAISRGTGVGEHIACRSTPEEAFFIYKLEKEKFIKEKADEWKSLIEPEVYEAMYNWIVEITD